ncbi:hypothetical protein D3C79_814560 [compost metagenome]
MLGHDLGLIGHGGRGHSGDTGCQGDSQVFGAELGTGQIQGHPGHSVDGVEVAAAPLEVGQGLFLQVVGQLDIGTVAQAATVHKQLARADERLGDVLGITHGDSSVNRRAAGG